MDAIRWCLGEQSMRDIRGQTAQDVIYAGPRRTLGMAEVRMAFERRRDDDLDVPGDLSVARRLYRSGESEYLLDGQRVRLRDVTDALRAIGIDEAEHVVVNQGMGDALLSASAMDRRGLLEQAAGLAGYRTRRDEARSKLVVTRRNVDTIATVLAEMEPRLRMLRRQARAVTERDEAKRRLRSRLELWLAHRWKNLERAMEQLGEQRAEVDAERTEATSDVARLEEQAESVLEVERSWQQEMDVAAASVYLCQKERDAAGHALEACEQKLHDLRARLEERSSRLAEIRDGERLSDERRDRLVLEIAAFRQRANELAAEHSTAEAGAATLRSRLGDLSLDSEARSLEMHAKRQRLDELLESVSLQRRVVTDQEERIGRLQSWISRAQEEADGVDAELRSLEEQLESVRDKVREVSAAHDEARTRAGSASARLAKLDHVEARIRTSISDLSRQIQNTSRVLAALEPQIASSPLQNLTVKRGWEEAVSAAIGSWSGERSNCDLADFLEWRSRLEGSLKDSIVWGDTFCSGLQGTTPLHATAMVERDDQVGSLWATLAGKPAHTIGSPPFSVVSRGGKKLSALGEEPNPVDETRTRYLQARRQKEDASSRLDRMELRVNPLAAAREPALQGAAEWRKKVEVLSIELAESNETIARITARAERLRHQKDAITNDLPPRLQELNELLAGQQVQVAALSAGEQERGKAAADLQALSEDEGTREQAVAGVREEAAAAERTLADLTREGEAVEARRATHEHLLEALHRGRERATSELQKLDSEAALLREQEESIVGELSGLREKLELEDERVREAVSRRETVEGRRPEHSVRTVALQEARRRLSDVIPRHERVLARLEHLQTDREALTTEIEEELSTSPDGLPEVLDDIPTAEEVQRLRARASQYADADESVIEESRELEERFAYLQTHAEDLRAAADNLQEIMQLADNEMRGRFADAFAAVNAEFGRVFEVMLRGGHAELIENADGGVDIVAQLPGKKTRSSAAFSGGERSLVASSLLFGVLRIRPTPFCVLDEVDAALDESNVDRYLAALRDISERTQIVVVTHNRATMAATDTLYGMTMDDEGVSSLLSLRLDAYAAG